RVLPCRGAPRGDVSGGAQEVCRWWLGAASWRSGAAAPRGAHARVWTRAAPLLHPPYRVLAPDLRGHGDSGWSEEGYGTLRYVADLVGWLDALGLDRVDLVGHSAGGRAALMVAAK